jgi:hypothetical protein
MGMVIGSSVDKEGELAKVIINRDNTIVEARNDVLVEVYKRTKTTKEAVSCLQATHNLCANKQSSTSNDMDVTDDAKISAADGLDYIIHVYPKGGKQKMMKPEVFQIIFDRNYSRWWPEIRILEKHKAK